MANHKQFKYKLSAVCQLNNFGSYRMARTWIYELLTERNLFQNYRKDSSLLDPYDKTCRLLAQYINSNELKALQETFMSIADGWIFQEQIVDQIFINTANLKKKC